MSQLDEPSQAVVYPDDEKYDEEAKAGIPGEDVIADVAGAFFDDPNLDLDHIVLEDDSPYPEVRSAVANTDDPDMPCNTLRAWILGLFWAIILPALNQFFFFRYPSVTISNIVAQLLSYPMGRFMAAVLPRRKIFGMSINPGPFTVKEHVLATIMATVSSQSAYATDIVAVQRVFYHETYSLGYQWMVVMSTQLIGFAIGGIAKRFLVSPPSMIWPANLVYCALFNTLHSQQYSGIGSRGGISRERFFFYALCASTAWYFFPGYIFGALSVFNWVCWIVPDNVPVNAMFGYQHGMGMSLVTFDWAQIAYIGSPLATPWWAEANIAVGFVFFFWILVPALYFSNALYSSYLPISSRGSYNNKGKTFNVTKILNADRTFNETLYQAYSPLFLSATFATSYGLSFASITSTLMHTILYFRKQIWVQARRSLSEQPDIHARLMSKYKEVPEWWYLIIFLAMFVFGIISIEVWPTQMPVWAFVLALIISYAYVIPIGMIQAITNQQIGLNVVTELIIGYALPGKPVCMMLFKVTYGSLQELLLDVKQGFSSFVGQTWGYITMAQAMAFVSDFKLGHYMKIPPRAMFMCQVVATSIAGTVQLGVQAWMFSNIPDICHPDQKNGFICPSTQVFGTASIIWGVIGPKKMFSEGKVFYTLVFFFLIGAILPCIPYLITKRYPNSWFRYVNFPVIFSGTGSIPPASAVNYVPWAIVGFIFQYVIRRRHFDWWTKYNYVLSAALDGGVAVGIVVVFFCLQYPQNGNIGLNTIQAWWGNTVFLNTVDATGKGFLPIPDSGTFGPATWG